ncbi:hypothetical protein D3877_10805 [Azospirillum cavernae]|uniref:Uncharacterized protein n=1 Tax=Azospirillum cavernae TaxID=2320860 RepID=A0A418W4S3_9PROT|nr:hypothetical protein [Azospirillum cavernae]RJF84947.1 hypothetical protein D3877_10805 [Azospirillum cavernae]
MSNSYVDGKVREAILASKGSRALAQKILMSWAASDPDLLRGMAQPFLKAIVAAAIERAARPQSSAPTRARSGAAAGGARPSASGLSRDALENVLNQLGREAGDGDGGASSRGAAPVDDAQRSTGPAAAGGPNHEKAMMAIAKAFVAKKIR